jgi:hypothetical protein
MKYSGKFNLAYFFVSDEYQMYKRSFHKKDNPKKLKKDIYEDVLTDIFSKL